MRANERRMRLIEELCERKFDTIDNLAFELGVSRRTICYDIEELSLSYPIFTAKGTGGGVWVRDGYRLGRRYLTEKQRELLERRGISEPTRHGVLRRAQAVFRYLWQTAKDKGGVVRVQDQGHCGDEQSGFLQSGGGARRQIYGLQPRLVRAFARSTGGRRGRRNDGGEVGLEPR